MRTLEYSTVPHRRIDGLAILSSILAFGALPAAMGLFRGLSHLAGWPAEHSDLLCFGFFIAVSIAALAAGAKSASRIERSPNRLSGMVLALLGVAVSEFGLLLASLPIIGGILSYVLR